MNYDRNAVPDPDDYFHDSRMSFGDHIEDLRTHLMRAIKGFLIAMVLSLFIGKPVLQFIARPVEQQLEAYWDRYHQNKEKDVVAGLASGEYNGKPIHVPTYQLDLKELSQRLNLQVQFGIENDFIEPFRQVFLALDLGDLTPPVETPRYMILKQNPRDFYRDLAGMQRIIRPTTLSTLSVQEAFVVFFKVAILCGFVLSSPWVFYQIWAFVAAGLYPHEKRLVNVYLPVSLGLFLGGVIICELFVIPKAIEALLWFNEWLDLQPDPRLNEWLSFAIFMPLVFGLSFQTPIVMMFMERIGLFSADDFRGKRRIAWFAMAVFAAVITPSTDAFSMLFLWLPMCMLYELGIWLCALRPRSEWELEEGSEEMIEV